jgi:hypothetical protein
MALRTAVCTPAIALTIMLAVMPAIALTNKGNLIGGIK